MPRNSIPSKACKTILIFACFQIAISGDADIISDFIVPPNVTKVDGRLFTCTALRSLVGAKPPTSFTASKVSMPEFPALNGQSVSYAFLQYPAGTLNPPHTHPPSAELLFLVDGCLEVGLVDTANKHSVPSTLFTTGVDSGILAEAFETDVATIEKIKAGFA
ncbi:germin-like protein 1 [Populus alba x Populus x berolinensis]|nr:germin-like protein 1 [Populus alba x Populus x berolinensis]